MKHAHGTTPLTAFEHVRPTGDGWMARCPAHDDTHNSLSIGRGDDGRWLLHCHAGCSLAAILEAAQLTVADIFPEMTSKASIVAVYPYHDEVGMHLYDVVRFVPKGFRQRRANGAWNMDGVRRVLYRLPDLQNQTTVYVTEGEKDADRLCALGLTATTNVGGASKWLDAYTKQLVAAHVQRVVVLPDNDEPGRQHADAVAASCHGHGLEVKIVTVPDLPPKGDVSDFLITHSLNELAALVQQTKVYTPSGNGRPSPNSGAAPTMPLATLLAMIDGFIRKFVVLTDEQTHAIALWVAHTYLFDAAEATPYLSITSAVKRSGKTQLLEVLDFVVHRPWLTGRVSAAVLVRKVDAERPTLLLDESDATFNQESDCSEALRGLLNSGYRASGTASSCVGQGAGLSYKDFSTFCPKAIAGIGSLPDTVRDRAIVITLKRRTRVESIQRFRQRLARGEAAPIREELARWPSPGVLETLRVAEPVLPDTLNHRAQDVWEPLLAIADLAGGEWPRLAVEAAKALAGSLMDDDIEVELLSDIRDLLETLPPGDDFVATTVLLEYLVALDDRPWATWRKAEQPLTSHGLRRLLQPFDIHPDRCTVGGAKVRGYRRDAFEDAIARYVPIKVAKWSAAIRTRPEPANSKWSEDAAGTTSKGAETPLTTGDGPLGHFDPGNEAVHDKTDEEDDVEDL